MWTTNAQYATYGLLLARTDADVPKHKGLTMFVLPMDAEGVSVRPLRQISGDAHFNEVFFDDVQLEAGSEVGPVDGGWGVGDDHADVRARRDRPRRRGLRLARRPLRRGAARTTRQPRDDQEVRHRFGEIAAEFLALRFTGYRMLTTLQRGGIPGPEGALAKVTTIKAAIAAGELLVDVLGPDGALEDDHWGELVSDLPGLKSAGGTEEILRNMVGERVLGLPPEPRLDKGIPFSELRAKEREAIAHELRADRRAGVPQGGRARRAVALQDRRGGARGARRRRAARPVADRASRPAGPACWSPRSTAARASA